MTKVSVSETKGKLKNLRNYFVNSKGGRDTYEFADYLADQLKGDALFADEFLLFIELAFLDLKRGTDAFTGEIIRHRGVDRVPVVEFIIRMDLPGIFDAIFPPEFARELKIIQEEISTGIKNSRK